MGRYVLIITWKIYLLVDISLLTVKTLYILVEFSENFSEKIKIENFLRVKEHLKLKFQ